MASIRDITAFVKQKVAKQLGVPVESVKDDTWIEDPTPVVLAAGKEFKITMQMGGFSGSCSVRGAVKFIKENERAGGY